MKQQILNMSIPPKEQQPKCKFISIEGNIGSGKSTILKMIRQRLPQLTALDEPLAQWQTVGKNKDVNLLELYYKNPQRWGFTFQIYAFMTRLRNWNEYSQMKNEGVKLSERSLLSDRYIFASIMKDMNILDTAQHQIYLNCYQGMLNMKNIVNLSGVIYVKCDPETCEQRIKKRAREGEGSIPLQYLQKIHDKHESWLSQKDKENIDFTVLTIDNTRPINEELLVSQIKEWLKCFENTQK